MMITFIFFSVLSLVAVLPSKEGGAYDKLLRSVMKYLRTARERVTSFAQYSLDGRKRFVFVMS